MDAYIVYGTNLTISDQYGFEAWLVYAANEDAAMELFLLEYKPNDEIYTYELKISNFKVMKVGQQDKQESIFIGSYYE